MALVNADYEFLYVNVGCNGRNSDAGVIESTKFYDRLQETKLNLPDNNRTKNNINFVFVSDDAFALHPNVLKPYSDKNLRTSVYLIIDHLLKMPLEFWLIGLRYFIQQ